MANPDMEICFTAIEDLPKHVSGLTQTVWTLTDLLNQQEDDGQLISNPQDRTAIKSTIINCVKAISGLVTPKGMLEFKGSTTIDVNETKKEPSTTDVPEFEREDLLRLISNRYYKKDGDRDDGWFALYPVDCWFMKVYLFNTGRTDYGPLSFNEVMDLVRGDSGYIHKLRGS